MDFYEFNSFAAQAILILYPSAHVQAACHGNGRKVFAELRNMDLTLGFSLHSHMMCHILLWLHTVRKSPMTYGGFSSAAPSVYQCSQTQGI